jgi:predicted enzyme related to lactoylglutathione lyase
VKEEVKEKMDHTIVHFEIPATDVEKLKAFYEGLFGWKIFKVPMGGMEYWLIYTVPTDEKGMLLKPGVNGGMFQKQAQQEGLKPVNYITIENIDESLEKVGKLGGKILMSKQQVPTVGWVALVVDPEGNQVGLLQPEQM